MEPKTKINLWYAVLAVLGVLLLNQWLSAMYAPTRVPYSQFLTALEKGRVIEVVITKDSITGKMRPPGTTTGEMAFTTTRVPPDLSKKLAKYKVIFRGKVESTFFRNLMSWVLPAIIFFGLWMFVIRRMNPGGQMMSFGRNKAKVFAEKDVSTRFEDVAGADEAKAEVEELVDFLKDPGLFQNLGGRLPKGVLLVGPPGTGKTLLARAVAGEAGVPFFSISGSDFVEMFVGMGAARVRDLFSQARENAPCIIFIDELDAIGKVRGMGVMGGHDEREQTLNQLLVEMDGFDPRVGVIILAATNRPEILDPALLRAGRFDRHILVDKPDLNGREAILKIHAQNVELGPDVDLHVIAQKTPGFSGADLANAINEAALLAARQRKDAVDMADLDEAVDRIIGGLEKKNRVINPQEKRIVAHHESGHAIVAAFTPDAEPVHKISIIPRGLAALGYTQQRPTEDRYLMSRRELLGKIDVLLGGRVAEDLIFGDLTTGAHNDLQRATEIARAMVTEYGMGQTLGPATFPRQVRPMFLSPDQNPYGQAEYGQATADKVDEEIKSILEDRQAHVRQLLESRRDLLTDLAQTLLQVETVSEEEFKAIVARHDAGPVQKKRPPAEKAPEPSSAPSDGRKRGHEASPSSPPKSPGAGHQTKPRRGDS